MTPVRGRLRRPLARLGVALLLVVAALPVSTPGIAATVTGASSCAGYDFHPIDHETHRGYVGATSEVWADGNGPRFMVCNPSLPQGAVVTRVRFTVADRGDGGVRFCGLYRTDLRASRSGAAQELASMPPTPQNDGPGLLRLTDTSIKRATIDNTTYAYWLQCALDGGVVQGGDPLTSLRGASVTYRIRTGTPTTRATSCSGYGFVPLHVTDRRAYDGPRSESYFVPPSAAGGWMACDPRLPQGAVVKRVQVTVADRGDGSVRDCGLFRTPLDPSLPGAAQVLARVSNTPRDAGVGVTRRADTTIARATIDNTRFAYWLGCRLDGEGSTPRGLPAVSIRGASVTFRGGTPSAPTSSQRQGATSCAGYAFDMIDSEASRSWYDPLSEVYAPFGAGMRFFVCDPSLPHGTVVTRVRFTVADRSTAHSVRFCGLYRTDLRTSANGGAQELVSFTDTPLTGTPGVVRLTATTIQRATVDNTRYAYWLQCLLESPNLVAAGPQTGLRGANVVYRIGG